MLVLSRGDLEPLLVPLDVIEAIAGAFRRGAEGRVEAPPRRGMAIGDQGVLLLMPSAWRASAGEPGALGVKLITYYGDNRARGHPTLYASYLLLDVETGQPLALLEGTFLTALRTGAVSALAARHLARPESHRVVCFGAGTQAAFQLRCLAAVLPIERIDVVARDPDRARRFVADTSRALGVPAELARDARAAVREADLVTCATTSTTPVVHGADLRPGTHLDLVGAFRPTDREADTEAVRRARVVVDTYGGGLEEAGDLLVPLKEGAITRSHVTADLAELVTGARPGRQSPTEITLFKSVGWALEDLATARFAYERARREGTGTEVRL